jgi:glycosyl transferase, family 25
MKEYFKLLNSYYDKIYVLSVEGAASRRKLFAERFEGLEYSFFYGADKNKFIPRELVSANIYSEILTKKNHRYGKIMRPGEIACSWSHRMMYEDVLKNNYSRVLIFEDDAVPNPEMMKKISEIINKIPGDCELLMWGWSKNGKSSFGKSLKQAGYHIQHALGLLKWNHTIIKNLYAKPFSANLKKAGFHDFTYAYGITKQAAKKLIAMQTPIQYIADNLLAHAATEEKISGYITWPVVFLHDSLPDGTAIDSYIR